METTNVQILIFVISIDTLWAGCVNYDYACKTNGLGMKYPDPNIQPMNSPDYSGCIDHCFQDTACKVFEFDMAQRICKFSSVFFDNIQSVPSSVLLWKKTPSISCKEDLTKGLHFFQITVSFHETSSYSITAKNTMRT